MLCYPQNETLVCTRQMCSVRDHLEEYVDTKAEIIGVSPGTPGEHKNFASNHRLPMPLLADPERRITRIFGAHWLWPISITRAIVVIDANGVVRSKRVMLRAFRPSDREIITSIYRARGDAMEREYKRLTKR